MLALPGFSLRSPEISLALAPFRLRFLVMTKRALFAVAGFLGLCLSVSAQPTQSVDQFPFNGSSIDRPFPGVPPVTLTDESRFSFLAFNWQAPLSFLPSFDPAEPEPIASPALLDRKKSRDDVVEMRTPDRVYVGGEVGFLYGRSSGKYGREDFQTYIIGTVGNEKFSITAGYLHQESSGRGPRWRR